MFKKNYTIKIASYSRNKKSINFKIPFFLFWSIVVCFLFVSLFFIYFSSKNIITKYQIAKLKSSNALQKEKIDLYINFYKDYFSQLEIMKFYLDNNFLVGGDSARKHFIETGEMPEPIEGLGGKKIKLDFDLNRIKANEVKKKKNALESLDNQQVIALFDNNSAYLNKSINFFNEITDSFEVNKNNNLEYLPFLFPVASNYLYKIQERKNYVVLMLKEKSNIFATAKGKIIRIEQGKNNRSLIVLKHKLGIETYYDGVEKVSVKKDQEVLKGEILGENSEESLLIYQIKIGNEFIPPLEFIISSIKS